MWQSYPLQTDKTQSLKTSSVNSTLEIVHVYLPQSSRVLHTLASLALIQRPKIKHLWLCQRESKMHPVLFLERIDNLLPCGQNWLDQKLIRKHGEGAPIEAAVS